MAKISLTKIGTNNHDFNETMRLDKYSKIYKKTESIDPETKADILKKIMSINPEIKELELGNELETRAWKEKGDYFFIHDEVLDELENIGDASVFSRLEQVNSTSYYTLFDKLIINLKNGNFSITDRYLYTYNGDIIDMYEVLKVFTPFDGWSAGKSARSQMKVCVPKKYKKMIGHHNMNMTRLMMLFIINGNFMINGAKRIQHLSNGYQIHHDNRTWNQCTAKLVHLTKKQHKKLGSSSEHRDDHRMIIRCGSDLCKLAAIMAA